MIDCVCFFFGYLLILNLIFQFQILDNPALDNLRIEMILFVKHSTYNIIVIIDTLGTVSQFYHEYSIDIN